MNFSYWELKSWFTDVDFTIIGSGIVGLNTAIHLKKNHPKSNILILEKGMLPNGASTKNAGFACFGSISEIIDDLETHSEDEVFNLVKKRWEGLQLLRQNLGDDSIDFQQNGGYELFSNNDDLFENCLAKKATINQLLNPIFKENVFSECDNKFNFEKIHNNYFSNQFEGQIDTGKMMVSLTQLAQKKGIKILNNVEVTKVDSDGMIEINTNFSFKSTKILIATNGFANQFLKEDLKPARAQVLITKPIENLHIKGTFHLDKGYYYFRNIDNRILFGGGRNLDFKTEETAEFGLTQLVQNKLEEILKTTILPDHPFEIEHRWSGIMGVGNQKKAIVKQVADNVYCGVRLGGMGVAIGSTIGKELAELI
ncbi:NAD(P)/FAD-dependent oxidoreductase [Urechidicola croceus]|uniref:FAD-dependent oxidoreductase n=1 Tax=Urechidicola croceus TaxID=1850246 RepID=A0A1D8P938_9FLAO|nr:FAD-dependent oxidoreductase [Urechidicola croceus]AOW21083.1 FAD-dependent oxidoreductase [Urechidicola croceus]